MADILCPMCGKPNPAETETCWNCQARLKPLVGPQQPEDDAPDWLSGLRGSSEEEDSGSGDAPAENGEVPDWLARIRGREEESQSSLPQDDPDDSDLPEWMKDLHGGQDSGSQGAETGAQPGDADNLPEWMKDQPAEADWMSSLRGEDSPTPVTPSTPANAGESDWLSHLASWDEPQSPSAEEPPQVEQPATPPASPSESWMADLSNWDANPPDISSAASQPESMDWSGEETTPAAGDQAEDEPQSTGAQVFSWENPPEADYNPGSAMTGELPDWLARSPGAETPSGSNPFIDDEPGEEIENSPDANVSSTGFTPFAMPPFAEDTPAPALPDGETPEWLKAFSADLPGGEGGSASLPDGSDVPHLPEGTLPPESGQDAAMPYDGVDLPDWLNKTPPAEDTSAKTPALEGNEDLAMAQLPGWLAAMRPVETVSRNTPPPEDDDRVESAGPLAGLVGALPGESLVTQVRKPAAYSARLKVSERQTQQAAMIEEMLGDEARPQAARGERSHVPEKIVRVVIALVLIAVVLIPLVSNLRMMPLPNLFQPDTVAFHRIVESLPANTPVLVAVDYEPGLSGEMQLAAAPVISQLNARAARLALISTNPSGPVLAENLLRAAGSNPNLMFTNLGFLPGGTAGLQEFASRPRVAMQYGLDGGQAWNTDALLGVEGLSNFGAVIVLTENAETARSWIEQVQPSMGSVPLLMVVSAQAAPMVQPYLDSGQVQGMVSGMSGGTMYAQISGQTGAWLDYWDSYQLGIFAAIAFILLGGVVQIFSSVFRRPASRKKA